jgi:hypothetical protein
VSTLPKESDDELREWMADWQTDSEPAADVREAIRRRVRRQSRGMVLLAAGELAFACGMLVFLIGFAVRHPQPIDVATMAGFSLLVIWATGYSLWYRRGLWRPDAETTASFLALAIRRCRRRLLALRAGWWLLGVEIILFVPWIAWHLQSAAPAEYVTSYGFLALMAGGAAAVLVVLSRRTQRELAELEGVRGGVGREAP